MSPVETTAPLPVGGTRGELGAYGERVAARFFQARGATVLDQNWRCRLGEIDLVVADGPVLAFVEVKTRRGLGFGDPVEAVTAAKVARLRRLAGEWLAGHPGSWESVRLDVIGVLVTGERSALRYLPGVGQ